MKKQPSLLCVEQPRPDVIGNGKAWVCLSHDVAHKKAPFTVEYLRFLSCHGSEVVVK